MKRGLRALAVMTAVAAAMAGPQAFAVCNELGGFAIFQCADRAYFAPPPAGAGTVSGVFWQIGFGNNMLNTAQGSNGTGNSGPSTFNGNDSGNWAVDTADALSVIGDSRIPAGALCLRNNNFGNAGIDGCCDNFRDTSLPGGTGDDGILNPIYNVYYARNGYPGMASQDWVVDYPVAVLFTESSGNFFAAAAVATMPRTDVNDVRVGFYNFKDVSNGTTNPITGVNNIIPWQRIPGNRDASDPNTNFVRNTTFVPGDTGQAKTLDLGWVQAVVHNDASSRPSTNGTVTGGGVGVAEMGGLVRYVVETQAIVDGNNPFGSLNPNGWTAVHTTAGDTAQIVVNPDTCVRLHTYFGKTPQTTTTSTANCRLGLCGDLGYDVVSKPACIGGPLASDGGISDLKASRHQGGVDVSWKSKSELSVSGYQVYAVGKKGSVLVAEASCSSCNTGQGGDYRVQIPAAKLQGARTLEVVAVGPGTKARTNIK